MLPYPDLNGRTSGKRKRCVDCGVHGGLVKLHEGCFQLSTTGCTRRSVGGGWVGIMVVEANAQLGCSWWESCRVARQANG